MRFVSKSRVQALVDFSLRLKERANVSLKQSLSILSVDTRQQARREEGQEGPILIHGIGGFQTRNPSAIVFRKIQLDDTTFTNTKATELFQIPGNIANFHAG